MITFPDLEKIAARRGVHIAWHHGGPKGAWMPHLKRISLRHGMSDVETLCTLAHEVGHLMHDHPAPASQRQEVEATMWAARRLVDPGRALTAAQAHPHSSAMVAHETGVTVHILRVWCSIVATEFRVRPENLPNAEFIPA